MPVRAVSLPDTAVLHRYAARPGCYTDCFRVTVPGPVDLPRFVRAFYTTWLFRLERIILKWAVRRPSIDADIDRLMTGAQDSFAAWSVEARAPDQILMCDMAEATRNWFMVRA